MRTLLPVWFALFAASAVLAQGQINNFAQPIATTVQLPTFGVSFDAAGVLQLKTFTDPSGRLIAERAAAARAALPGDLGRRVELRKVSIVRLQSVVSAAIRDGRGPDDVMQKLAGLTRVTAIFCYPDTGDIVIAGPAEPWAEDLSSTAIGIHSGRPTLLLADLVVALRAYQPNSPAGGFVGCTINPRAEGLARLQQFQKQIPRSVSDHQRDQVTRWVADGVQQSLGMADVKVFGISASTHFARVMIEADYRMKRIAIGVEPPPVRMTTFAAALTSASHQALERWWFTPAYDAVHASPDRLAMQITGQGVQLQTEHKTVLSDGTIIDAALKPTRATRAFATSFTKRYDDIARASPIYAQLRQLTDFLIAAAYIRQHDWYAKANWRPAELLDENVYAVNTLATPVSAPWSSTRFGNSNECSRPPAAASRSKPTKRSRTSSTIKRWPRPASRIVRAMERPIGGGISGTRQAPPLKSIGYGFGAAAAKTARSSAPTRVQNSPSDSSPCRLALNAAKIPTSSLVT